jgi:hypothetical protein
LGKLHKRVPNYSAFSLKGTNVAKRSIECKNLSKPFNVGYSVTLRSKSMTEPKTRAFYVIYLNISPLYALIALKKTKNKDCHNCCPHAEYIAVANSKPQAHRHSFTKRPV